MAKTKSFREMERERAVPVTTTIPLSKWHEIKKARLSWNSLILKGFDSINGFEGLTNRSRESEKAIHVLERNMARLQTIIIEQGETNEKLNKKLEKLQKVVK